MDHQHYKNSQEGGRKLFLLLTTGQEACTAEDGGFTQREDFPTGTL